MILKYILINSGFIAIGFLISYLVDLAGIFNLSDAHDKGLTNLFLSIFIFAILGLITSGLLYRENKILVGISIILIVALVIFAFYIKLF